MRGSNSTGSRIVVLGKKAHIVCGGRIRCGLPYMDGITIRVNERNEYVTQDGKPIEPRDRTFCAACRKAAYEFWQKQGS